MSYLTPGRVYVNFRKKFFVVIAEYTNKMRGVNVVYRKFGGTAKREMDYGKWLRIMQPVTLCTLCAAVESPMFYTGCLIKDGHGSGEFDCDGRGHLTPRKSK
jgi:hypothetical protein